MATIPSEAALLDEIRQLRARIAALELEREIPKEIVDKAPMMISIVRAPEFVYEFVNPAFQALAPGKQFLGRPFAEVWAEVSQPLVSILQDVIATARIFQIEDAPYTIQRGPGMPPETVYVSYAWIPLSGPDGRPDRVLTLAHEVTASVRQRQQLAESREAFRTLADNSPDNIDRLDRDFRHLYVNPACANMMALSAEEIIGKTNREIGIPDPWASIWEERLRLVFETSQPLDLEDAFPTRQGMRYFQTRCAPERAPDGNISSVLAVSRDITERQQTAEERERLLVQLQTVLDSITDGVVIAGSDGTLLSMNPAALAIHGFESLEQVRRHVLEFKDTFELYDEFGRPLPLEDSPIARTLRGEAFSDMEVRVVRKDTGRSWTGSYSGAPGRNQAGEIVLGVIVLRDISARKRAEDALRDSEQTYSAIFDNAPYAMALTRMPEAAIIRVNDAFLNVFECAREDVLGTITPDLMLPGTGSQGRVFEEFQLRGRVRDCECVRTAKSGDRRILSLNLDWVMIGGRKHVLTTMRDITESKRAEEALRETEARFRSVLEDSRDVIYRFNVPSGRFEFISPSAADVVAFSAEELMAQSTDTALAMVHPEDRAVLQGAIQKLQQTGKAEAEYRQLCGNGGYRWVSNQMALTLDSAGQPLFRNGSIRDITGRKLAEEALQRQAELLKLSFDAMIVWQLDGAVESWNLGAERLYGFTEAEAVGRVTHELLATEFPKPWEEIRADLTTAGSWEGELHHRTRNGRELVVSARLQLIRSASGTERVLEINRDVTRRKRAEEALLQSEARERARAAEFEAILDAAPVAIFVAHDAECRQMSGSRLTYEILGLAPGSNVSTEVASFRAMKNGQEIGMEDLPAHKAAATGKPVRNDEFEITYADGSNRHMLGDAVPLFDEQGRPRGAVGAFVDITERKRSEEKLRQTQKLESVGLLAGGIAHDFNNLLVGIMGNASMALEDLGDAESAGPIKEVILSAERAANLTRQLLAYSGQGQFVIRDINMSDAVNEISGLVEFSIPKSVQLAVTVERRLPNVRMDPSQLQQILMNLVINAGEAIGEGNPGKITIATSMVDIGKPFVDALGADIAPGRYVAIAVTDTGSGISEAARARIFDPFFTTKFTGRGLGLAAVAGILRTQKGGITVESIPGSGSTFRVFLPAAERQERGPENQPAEADRATVLVVDDEPSVRNFIGAVLRRNKYRVLLASDGRDALAVCEREAWKIDAAILDVVMPLMGANDLVPALKVRRPDMRVLLTSGYSEAEARRLCAAYPGATFIQKPYTAQQVARAMNELLGVTRPGTDN